MRRGACATATRSTGCAIGCERPRSGWAPLPRPARLSVPPIGRTHVPATAEVRRVIQLLARLFLSLTGWKSEGARPRARRFVLIAAPHTSNWDLAFLLAFSWFYGIKPSFMAKHSLFRWPMGPVMRLLGGIPIQRHRRGNVVDQMADTLRESEDLALTVPAEGTRSYADHWKSGFYHIARKAEVPIVLSFLDYERKVGGFGPEIVPSGDLRADMKIIRDFYADKKGRYPEQFSPVRLPEEDED
ncbi:MAG: lysophospholipid acyltransferase family protein [Deltaproteobacteria bacterium]|nr:lysophospholipid acyltransferase family protein [Deltaproteobacteria bacterium]